MATSETDIMNSALTKLGAERILSVNDDSNRARLCKTQYPLRRDALLYGHPWRFNKGYAILAPLAVKPEEIYDYPYVFQLPNDCFRVFHIDGGECLRWEEIGDNLVAAEVSQLNIKYGKKITDASLFDAMFCEVLASDLAADLAYAITQNVSREKEMKDQARLALMQARSYSAQQASIRQVGAQSWLNARRR